MAFEICIILPYGFPWMRQTYFGIVASATCQWLSNFGSRFDASRPITIRHSSSPLSPPPLLPNNFLTYHPIRRQQNTENIVKMRTLWEETSQRAFYRVFNWHWQLGKLKHLDGINRNVCHKNVSRLVLASRWHTAAHGAHVNSKDFHFDDFSTDNR